MSKELIIAIIFMNLALLFYSIGVWSEKIQKTLKPWHLAFFYLGLICDTTGTGAMEKIAGGLSLGKAKGGEPFFPLGAEEDAPALPEEIIYYDQEGAVCRCLNWREAQRTMLTEETRQAILVMEAVTEEQAERAKEAMDELKGLVKDYFGVEGKIYYVSTQVSSLEV